MLPRNGHTLSLLAAAAIHAALLFGCRPGEELTPPQFGMEAAPVGVAVTLVAALPAPESSDVQEPMETPEPPEISEPAEPVEPIETPEVPDPPIEPQPQPQPQPEPVPEILQPGLAPEPTPEPTPRSAPPPSPPSPSRPPRPPQAADSHRKPAPRRNAVSGDGSAVLPGHDATSATGSSGGGSSKPGYRRNPQPPYPEEARRLGQQGIVYLKVDVNPRGVVTAVEVSRSSGHPLLDESACATVRKRWVFKPALRGNIPVAAQVIVPIRFTLEDR